MSTVASAAAPLSCTSRTNTSIPAGSGGNYNSLVNIPPGLTFGQIGSTAAYQGLATVAHTDVGVQAPDTLVIFFKYVNNSGSQGVSIGFSPTSFADALTNAENAETNGSYVIYETAAGTYYFAVTVPKGLFFAAYVENPGVVTLDATGALY